MDRHPEQHRFLMSQRVAEQRERAARRRGPGKMPAGEYMRRRLVRPPLRRVARLLFRLAFALDSSAVWAGLWKSLSASETATGTKKRPR